MEDAGKLEEHRYRFLTHRRGDPPRRGLRRIGGGPRPAAMSGDVDVRLAKLSERPLIDGLMQFYFYDFSEMEPDGSTEMEIGAEGRFGAYVYLPGYWEES